jgi:hypothetical protein
MARYRHSSVSFNKSLLNSFEIARDRDRNGATCDSIRACARVIDVVGIRSENRSEWAKTPAASPLRRELMTRRTKS